MIRLAMALCLLAFPALARPNFIIVTLDDAQVSEVATAMPLTLAMPGMIKFDRMLVEDTICAPSRAAFFTGQYAHNNGVQASDVPESNSGERAMKANEANNTLAVWLNRAGYRTGLAGKYMNGYTGTALPAGWNEWAAWNGGVMYDGFNYKLNENGHTVSYGTAQTDFATDVVAQKAINFIRNAGNQPWFFYLAPTSGHASCGFPARHAGLYTTSQWPGPKEVDVTDKPPLIQALSTNAISASLYRSCLRSLASADEAVQHIWDVVTELGEADNTWIFIWSDNGFHFGEHKLPAGKITAYETDERVPLMVRGPTTAVRHDTRLVGNVDLAPTVLELAGVPVPTSVDGTSLAPLLAGQSPAWRTAFPVRHWWVPTSQQHAYPDYKAVRTERWKYVEWSTGDRELYDLTADPNELENLASDPSLQSVRAELSARVAALATCQGAGCRAAER